MGVNVSQSTENVANYSNKIIPISVIADNDEPI
jgi:hypothetical protein